MVRDDDAFDLMCRCKWYDRYNQKSNPLTTGQARDSHKAQCAYRRFIELIYG
jgi:hypothetical protein